MLTNLINDCNKRTYHLILIAAGYLLTLSCVLLMTAGAF